MEEKKVFHVFVSLQFQKNEVKGKIEVQQTLKGDDVILALICKILSSKMEFGDCFTVTGKYQYNM